MIKNPVRTVCLCAYLVLFSLCTCDPANTPGCVVTDGQAAPDSTIPRAVFLDMTAENKSGSPITIRVRHYYNFNRYGTIETTYSDWDEICLDAGETENIGCDAYAGKKGMHLLNDEFGDLPILSRLLSSFEMEIHTEEKAFYLAGYCTEDTHFNESGLAYFFSSYDDLTGISHIFITKTQAAYIWREPFVLPVKLTVFADGTYAFSHDTITNRDGVSAWRL